MNVIKMETSTKQITIYVFFCLHCILLNSLNVYQCKRTNMILVLPLKVSTKYMKNLIKIKKIIQNSTKIYCIPYGLYNFSYSTTIYKPRKQNLIKQACPTFMDKVLFSLKKKALGYDADYGFFLLMVLKCLQSPKLFSVNERLSFEDFIMNEYCKHHLDKCCTENSVQGPCSKIKRNKK
jgi:hypothetical protein